MLNSLIHTQYCYSYLIDQISIPLLLYAHLPSALVALFIGVFLIRRNRDLPSLTLLAVILSFAIWCILSLSTWFAFLGAENTMFTWSIIDLFGLTLFIFSYYFLYTFVTHRDLPGWQKVISVILVLPTFLFTFLGQNLVSFDSNVCESVENEIVTAYPYYSEAAILLAVLFFTFYQYRKAKKKDEKRIVLLAGSGVSIFLFFFLSATYVASVLVNYEAWAPYAYNYEIYGLFGMPILLGFLAFLAVRFHSFNLKVFGSQVLVVVLWILIGSILFVAVSSTTRIIVAITEVLAIIFGLILIKSVKKEIALREQIGAQKKELEIANEKLKVLDKQKTEFLSFASHQLRSPLTAIKGYSSMMLENSFGQLGEPAKKAANVVLQSAQKLLLVVEDFLNITRIELGTMKYDFAEADLKELVEGAVATMQPVAAEHHLTLSAELSAGDNFKSVFDAGKISQVVSNLIDNAIKYTSEGSIRVSLKHVHLVNGERAMRIEVKDTGVGIDPETMSRLFQKFSRAYDASRMNAGGTGLGLYVARQLVEAHGGKLWAESRGKGQGTTFVVELPLASSALHLASAKILG